MALIEIIPTIRTNQDTLASCLEFGKSLGKTVITTRDSPGFIVNRLVMPSILDGIRMLEDGISNKEDIDKSVQLGLNHPIGPLALADLIGLDVVFSIANSIYEESKERQFAPPILLRKMVTAGWLGRKTGKGFYEY
jgi:3-hydroxybutyryl-CoA dehydrogenase